ncbi:MAG: hypothetical protein J4F39_01450 [Candidatus Latescibacteria bacterium]|nr:hypothetical protein [Candidatus Latescibacterota bacterium]
MPYLSATDKCFFKENGCLIVRGVLTTAQVRAARDALWTGIEADRDDPSTWIDAGPRTPVPANHPAIRATVHESPLKDLLSLLANSGYDGPLVVELKGVDRDEPLPAVTSARVYVEALL